MSDFQLFISRVRKGHQGLVGLQVPQELQPLLGRKSQYQDHLDLRVRAEK